MDTLDGTFISRDTENRLDHTALTHMSPSIRLAPELLEIIISHVDSESLANVALVNRTCCELARSYLFRNVCFDYSPNSSALLSHLLESTSLASSSGNSRLYETLRRIGPYIQRAEVLLGPEWIEKFHGVSRTEGYSSLDESARKEIIAASQLGQTQYMRLVESVISSREILPRLKFVDWLEWVAPQPTFFAHLITSSIEHLIFGQIAFDEEFEFMMPPVSTRWNLKSLRLTPAWVGEFQAGSVVPMCASILRSCAHSLENLFWRQHGRYDDGHSFGSDPAMIPNFESLEYLNLCFTKFRDINIAKALLDAPLKVLDLTHCDDQFIEQALEKRGKISSLEIALLTPRRSSISNYVNFLKANTQMSKLVLQRQHNTTLPSLRRDWPEEYIFPLLTTSFHALRSLCLTWGYDLLEIPETALAALSSLKTLEQVALSTGCQIGWRYNFAIDHDAMRRHLPKLPNLKRIAFRRDTYHFVTFLGPPNAGNYYGDRYPPPPGEGDAPINDDGDREQWVLDWEKRHLESMLDEAVEYAELMPQLEWIFVGQYAMDVDGEMGHRQVMPVNSGNYGRSSLEDLTRMFRERP